MSFVRYTSIYLLLMTDSIDAASPTIENWAANAVVRELACVQKGCSSIARAIPAF
jgi:hypothetical protein